METQRVEELISFIERSPTAGHAVNTVAAELRDHGFEQWRESDVWRPTPGAKFFVVRGGSVVAFVVGQQSAVDAGFRLICAHTDSPNFRIKPVPLQQPQGYVQLGVEPYGSPLFHTWLDRDLCLAGQVVTRSGPMLVHLNDVRIRIPSLAVHLNRNVNTDGLQLNAQKHLVPLIELGTDQIDRFENWLAPQLDNVRPDEILSWDLGLCDLQRPQIGGTNDEFLYAPRLDNLASCHAALSALCNVPVDQRATLGIALYDHEEVGSRSANGAASTFLMGCLQRLAKGEDGMIRAANRSFLISADMAHAVHPNYVAQHEPSHQPRLGGGPVIKFNADQSYATDAGSWARFESWAREAGIKTQRYVVRSDMRCGSTVGPITAALTGIRTVDVGNPMLSMHSCREMAATADIPKMIQVMNAFYWDRSPISADT